MSGRKALVLGATGTVGRALSKDLIKHGWLVTGAARCSDPDRVSDLTDAGITVITYDVTTGDPATLPEVDTVFLEIWDPGRPDLIWPINFHGVGRVVERYAGSATVVNGCTINVYGDGPEPSTENAPCRPTSEYGRSRYAQERLIDYFAMRGGAGAIHVRYAHANTAGGGLLRRMAEAILAGTPCAPAPARLVQVIALEDFVRVTRLAADRAACPPVAVNCCHPRIWTMGELAEAMRQRLGRGTVVFEQQEGGRENSACADASRMVEWFGQPTVELDKVLGRVARALTES